MDGNRKTAEGPAHDFQAFLRPDDVFDNADDFIAALRTETATSPRPDLVDFHRFFVVSKPYHLSNPMPYNVRFDHAVPTLFLRRLLSVYFRRRTTSEQVALISKISKILQPEALSFVYEPAILDVLCAPGGHSDRSSVGVVCHLAADCPASSSSFTLGPGLVLASDRVTADSTAPFVLRDNHIYLLRSGGGFPWINAFVVSEQRTRVTMLQTTVNYRREVVSSAVGRVVELVQRAMPNTSTSASGAIKWSFIFVSPGGRGETMAKALREVQFRGRRPTVTAGWLEVGAWLAYEEEVVVRA